VKTSSSASYLNPAQQRVSDHGLLESGFSVVLQMPTGSGKTWLAQKAIKQSLKKGFRAVYLSPLRALADELASEWQKEFTNAEVGVFTGDYGKPGRSLPVSYSDARVMIMTPERLDACTRSWRSHWAWIPDVDWLIVDEIHLLGDQNRGSRLEGAISRFKRINPFCRILGLSATLGNREELADWLEGVELETSWRPVPLEWKLVRYRKPEEKLELLANEVSRVAQDGGQSLVFVQSRRRAEQIASDLRERGFNALHHHAGLAHDQRRKVERAFRKNDTRILVATATLEMGLNLPVRQVVLYDLQAFDGVGFQPLSVNTVWQRAGRAGRLGLDDSGEVVLLAPTWERTSDQYSAGRFESIQSGIAQPAALAEQILVEVHSGLARTHSQLERVMKTSLAALQDQSMQVAEAIDEMLQAGMLRQEEVGERTLLKATRLGRIACRHQLKPATVLRLRRFLQDLDTFTDFDLLLVAASTPDCSPNLPVDFEDLETFAEELARRPSRLYEDFDHARDLLDLGGKQLLSSLKTALVIWRWTVTGDAETVAEEEGCYPFEISRLIEAMDRLLLAASSIRQGIDEPSPSEEGSEPSIKSDTHLRIELLRQKILNGIDGPAASLTLIKGIGASWASKLSNQGVSDLTKLVGETPETLARLSGLSEKRASQWIAHAVTLKDRVPSAIVAKGIPTLPPDSDIPVDPYRLKRAIELSVKRGARNQWDVSGGSEPRQVSQQAETLVCSCPDFAKGNTCKHLLAVSLHLHDPVLEQAISKMKDTPNLPYLDLFSLWFDRQ
jgi:helicase